jgi:glycosyltransferase involved in cell wall biosynthesis
MSDRAAATFTHSWAMVDSVHEVIAVRESKGLPHPKVRYFSLPSLFRLVPVLKSILLLVCACFISWAYRPDLICAVQMHPHGYYGYLISRLSRRPLVLHTVSQSQGGLGGFIGRNLRFAELRKAIAYKAVRHAIMITTTGYTTRQNLVSFGIPPSRVIATPSITDTNRFFPIEGPKKWDIITVTRFERLKRLDIFLRVVKEISRERSINVAIGGAGIEEENLRKICSQLGLDHIVTFIGWVDSESDLNIILNQSKVFLLTSQTEGFPTTISEALCAGTCCVAANVGDVSTVIDNNKNGILVSPFDNVEEYKNQIIRILDNNDFAGNLRQMAMKTCRQLSIEHRAEIFKKVISDFLIKPSNS